MSAMSPLLRLAPWCITFLLVGGTGSASAQAYSPPTGPLYQWQFANQACFDSVHAYTPDSIFYQEGGEYAEFQKYLKEWTPRLCPHGNREVHDQLMRNYHANRPATGSGNRSNEDPWWEIGPKRRTNAMIGIGPIRSIAIDATEPDNMLCTSSSGGLFYTTDAGGTWANAGTDVGWPHSGCQAAVYYPGSSTSWYAISAYALPRGANMLSYVGGIFRTANLGTEWERIGDQEDFSGPTTETQKLLFDRKLNGQSDHRLFLAATKGLYVCDNPSATDPADALWNLVNITPVPPSFSAWTNVSVDPAVRCYDIEYLPSATTSTLCAAMRFKVTHQVGVNTVTSLVWRFMLSLDNGDTWNEIANQPPIDETINFATVETSAAAPDAFYCLAERPNTVVGGITVYNCWVKAYDVLTSIWTDKATDFGTGFGAGHAFGVDQVNPNSVFVSRSTTMRWYLSNVNQGDVTNGHDDVEDIVGHPGVENKIWVANHGGVYLVDPSIPNCSDHSDGLGVAEVDALSTSETNPEFLVTGLNHDNTTLTRTPYGPGWDPDWDKITVGGDGTRCWVSRQDRNRVYSSSQSGGWKRSDNAGTSNAASSISLSSQWWSEGAIHRLDADRLYRASLKNAGTYSFTTLDDDGNPVPHNGTNWRIEIVRSEDGGNTNEFISDFANMFEVARPAEVIGNNFEAFNNGQFWWIRNTPANTDHLYVSLENWDWQQRLYRNTYATAPDPLVVKAHWEEVPHPRRALLGSGDDLREPLVAAMAFDPNEESIIYIAYSASQSGYGFNFLGDHAEKMVFRMDISDIPGDYPATGKFECGGDIPCSDLTMNLPNTTCSFDCLVYEQGSDGGLYISTEVGVYFTDNKRIAAYDPAAPQDADDLGNTAGWVRLGDALPHVDARGLEANYVINRLRVGTVGRGVWEHHLHCPDAWDFAEAGAYAQNTFLEARNDISSVATLASGLKVDYRAGNQVHLAAGFHATAGTAFHAFIHPCDIPGNSFHPKAMEVVPDEWTEGEEPEMNASMQLFPNPANGSFTVQADFVMPDASASIRIYGPTGNLVLTSTMRGPVKQIELSGLLGLYLVAVECNGVQRINKIMIQ